jgi:invasion protein IalB
VTRHKRLAGLLTVLVALLSAVAVDAQSAGADKIDAAERNFKDWHLRCEKNGDCLARTVLRGTAGPNRTDYVLRIERKLATGRWRILLTTIANLLDPSASLSFRVDAQNDIKFRAGKDYKPQKAVNDFVLSNDKKQAALMKLLREGAILQVTFRAKRAGKTRPRFSLKGLAAGLIWIQQQQDKAARSAAALAAPAARRAPQIPPSLIRRHTSGDQCGARKLLTEIPPVTSRLDNNHILYILPCQRAAYNITYRLYVVFKDAFADAQPLYFADYTDTHGWSGTDRLFNITWDTKTGSLTSFTKARGLGDCGAVANYRWQGFAFKLLKYRHWGKCDGSRQAADWPVIYSAGKK